MGRTDRARLRAAIEGLAEGQGDVRPLRGHEGEWRLRVGDWRVIFRLDLESRTIVVRRVRPRGDAYRP